MQKDIIAGLKKNLGGKPKSFQNPEQIAQLFIDYTEWNKTNYRITYEMLKSGDMAGELREMKTVPPLSQHGFNMYLRSAGFLNGLNQYRSNTDNAYAEYQEVISWVDEAIYGDRLDGAAVGQFNANVMTRLLHLVDKVEQTVHVEQPLFPDV